MCSADPPGARLALSWVQSLHPLWSSLTLTRARRGVLVASGAWRGKENKYHPCQKRLLMDPLNNQPNSLSVCEVGRYSIKSRLNIGSRVGPGAEGGCHRSDIVSSTGSQNSPPAPARNRWPPRALWEQIGVLFNQGLICKFHTSPAV